jgi:hypothetical protein
MSGVHGRPTQQFPQPTYGSPLLGLAFADHFLAVPAE